MEPNDNPAPAGTVTDTAAATTDAGRAAIDVLANILDDPLEADTEGDEAHAEEDAEAGEANAESEEDSGEKTEADKQDEPQATGGRFVEHTARVKLPDGTTTTVSELANGYFRQSDYTRKSQENAEFRRALDGEREQVSQTTQQLHTQLSRMAAMLDQWKPKRPEAGPDEDPMGWVTYQQQVEAWKEWQGAIDTENSQFWTQKNWEMQQGYQARLAQEQQLLYQKFPAMSDPAKRQTFMTEASRAFGAKYGFTPEEIGSIGDHRFILVIRDLMRADRLSARAPEVKDQIKGKPKMVRGGRRGGDPSQDAKRARIDRLRETGSRADGVRALMDLDL